MNGKLKYIIFAALGILIALYFYNKYNRAPGINFNEISLSDLQGNPVKFSDLKGKKMVVSFGASWCPNCIDEMNMISPIKNTSLADVEVVIISDEPLEKIQGFKDRKNYPFTFLKMNQPFNSIGVMSIPTTYIFNANLEQKGQNVGFIDWEDPSAVEDVKEMMK